MLSVPSSISSAEKPSHKTYKIASWARDIPFYQTRDSETHHRSTTWSEAREHFRPFSDLPSDVLEFFDVFKHTPTNVKAILPKADRDNDLNAKSKFSELNEFLETLRKGGRNMFVAPINFTHGLVQHKDSNNIVDIRVNVVWESLGITVKNHPWAFAALGDVCFVRMNFTDKAVKEVAFRHCSLPPEYPTAEELLAEHKKDILNSRNMNIGGYPSGYGDCSFSGSSVTLARGWFDEPWLHLRNIDPEGSGLSSFDLTGSWTAAFFQGPGWTGANLHFTDERDPCFQHGIGWMNDHTRSIVVGKLVA